MSSDSTIDHNEWRWVLIASSLLLLIVFLPTLLAYWLAPPDVKFMGFLVNPVDGASYLTKMREGYEGRWLFSLRYTPVAHQSVALFTFYLALGHAARLLSLSLIQAFDLARLLSGLCLFAAIYRLVASFLGEVRQRHLAWGLALVGAGFGWLALIIGHWNPVPPDILASADAFPIQTVLLYPHMAFASAIAAWMANRLFGLALDETERWPRLEPLTLGRGLGALALVNMTPYILAPIGLAYLGLVVAAWHMQVAIPWRELAWGAPVIVCALAAAAYSAWAVSAANPVIHGWMAQNVTLAPPLVDTLIAFGPLLLLAAPGWWRAWRTGDLRGVALSLWVLSALGLLYFPSAMQRRFLIGINIPLAHSAAIGLDTVILPALAGRWRSLALVMTLCLTTLSTVVALVLPAAGINAPAPYSFIDHTSLDALHWLEANAPPDSVVLASPTLSLYLPVYGLRVVYGHHFETVNGVFRLAEVKAFYTGRDCSVLSREGVQYVVVGPYEQQLAGQAKMCPLAGQRVYVSPRGDLAIYALP